MSDAMGKVLKLSCLFVFLFLQNICYGQPTGGISNINVLSEFDFSYCGYSANDRAIPLVKAVYAVEPVKGDATELIQQAIDKVSSLPLDKEGFRGAILLKDGEFKVYGQLVISASGVVLRGSDNTKLIAAGNKRRTLIDVKGIDDAKKSSGIIKVTDSMVKPGSEQITLENAGGLKVGDQIFITRPSTDEWIEALKMNKFVEPGINAKRLNWFKGSRDVVWDRTITKIEGNTISFNGPITTEIDADYCQATVVKYDWPGRIENVGIENLNCISEYDASNLKDEEHSWICVRMSNVKNGWVRNLSATHFATSAVMLQPTNSQITIDNCKSLAPVSEIGGQRRRSFYNGGQLNLFQSCYAEYGRHDFVSGFCSAGPNVFTHCIAENPLSFSGSVESWACGTLFDNVKIEGNAIRLTNLGEYSQGAGWAASNCVIWKCQAGIIEVDSPPMSRNYIYRSSGNVMGEFTSLKKYLPKNSKVLSIFADQLNQRGAKPLTAVDYPKENPKVFNPLYSPKKIPALSKKVVEIINGRFVCNGKVLWGGQVSTEIWEGSMTPKRARGGRPAITRFIPGRDGNGLTDDLEEIAASMLKQDNHIMIQRPGLWYDKRRCDHQIVKRIDGNVWGPFLEMPWARSGIGIGWDGLSKFDLTKFNPWYFSRIKEFADLCDQNGLILYNELHNNHNLVESAAHWVDYPWRPANHIQINTGITKPPPYDQSHPSGDRNRIHIADEYYDISHPIRADLHKQYIIKCIDDLKDNDNIIHTMAFQYAGTTEFAKFFLDVVREWEKENNKNIKLAIHTGKNVTDDILTDPKYADMIDVINMQYWHYFADGTLFALPAGENKAFREMGWAYFNKQKFTVPPTSEKMLYKQVREYRDVYPDKAIIANLSGVSPLPILMAGGAYKNDRGKNLHASFDKFVRTYLADFLWQMTPADDVVADSQNNWCLAKDGEAYLICSLEGGNVKVKIKKGNYKYNWFDHDGNKSSDSSRIKITKKQATEFSPSQDKPFLLLIKRITK